MRKSLCMFAAMALSLVLAGCAETQTAANSDPSFRCPSGECQGMNSAGFADFYKTYLGIRGQSSADPMVSDIHRRIGK